MRKLLNTLYVTSPDTYLSLDGENIVVRKEETEAMRLPLHNLESIVAFGYTGASPALMGACAKRGVALCFLSQSGRFLSRVTGEVHGNVLLRRKQFRVADEANASLEIARNMIAGKIHNCRQVLERAVRDHALRLDGDKLREAAKYLQSVLHDLLPCENAEVLRGLEGKAAACYFGVFDDLILQQKDGFYFAGRNRRPPRDAVNALLSFVYTLLAHDVAAALEAVGLDAYVGFFHTDRPGRTSLALDMMEELRPIMADRFVLSLINKREVNKKGFKKQEGGAVIMDADARKTLLNAWQDRKREMVTHPFLREKIPWGLIPHAQAMLLARYLRGDLDAYPTYLWK